MHSHNTPKYTILRDSGPSLEGVWLQNMIRNSAKSVWLKFRMAATHHSHVGKLNCTICCQFWGTLLLHTTFAKGMLTFMHLHYLYAETNMHTHARILLGKCSWSGLCLHIAVWTEKHMEWQLQDWELWEEAWIVEARDGQRSTMPESSGEMKHSLVEKTWMREGLDSQLAGFGIDYIKSAHRGDLKRFLMVSECVMALQDIPEEHWSHWCNLAPKQVRMCCSGCRRCCQLPDSERCYLPEIWH